MYIDEKKKPDVFGAGSFGAAVAVHLLLFLALWYAGSLDASSHPEPMPIELMVVVNENLDGVEDEPPPEKPPEPEPPEPEPPKPPEPEPPKPPPPTPEAVLQTPAETNTVKKVEKKEEKPKPPEPPKMTREERMKKMRESAKKVKDAPPPKPRNNGRTEMRPKDWEKLLSEGYTPGATNQGLDASENQRCTLLIKKAFHDKWESPPWNDRLREMHLSVQFGPGGEVKGYRLSQSSGDPAADKTVLDAAKLVPAVRGLSQAFLEANKTVTVRFKVTPM
jgi:outer membrane biosynthesis protein TonB